MSGVPIIRLDRPLVKWPQTKPAPTIDLSIPVHDVSSSIIPLRQEFSARDHALNQFEKVLDLIAARGCIFCFVDGCTHQSGMVHEPGRKFNLLRTKYNNAAKDLKNLFQMPGNIHVPFCYCCWVPFRTIGSNHPIPGKSQSLDPTKCPYHSIQPVLVPSLIAYIWEKPEIVERIEKKLGVSWKDNLGAYSSETLRNWLVASVGATQVQHPYLFINAFYETCISI